MKPCREPGGDRCVHRMDAVPSPLRSAAFRIHVCISAERYTLSRRAFATPWSLTFHGALAVRAARKQTMFAMLPPLTKMPPEAGS